MPWSKSSCNVKTHISSSFMSTGENKALHSTEPFLYVLPRTSYRCLFTPVGRCSSYRIVMGRKTSKAHGSTSNLPSQPYINTSKSWETSQAAGKVWKKRQIAYLHSTRTFTSQRIVTPSPTSCYNRIKINAGIMPSWPQALFFPSKHIQWKGLNTHLIWQAFRFTKNVVKVKSYLGHSWVPMSKVIQQCFSCCC